MRIRILLGLTLFGISACHDADLQDIPAQAAPQTTELALPDLTLAELHRVDAGGGVDCDLQDDGSWECVQRTQTARVLSFHPAAEKAAPFAAQIYLHPEFTSEEYLLEKDETGREMWSLRHVCGATLIAPNWVVTAAHCFPDPKVDTSYGIRLGITDIENEVGFLYHVQEVVRRAPPESPTRQNDIALVRFDPNEAKNIVISQRDLAEIAPDAPPILTAEFQNEDSLLSVIDGYGRYHAVDTTDWMVRASSRFTTSLDFAPEANSLVTAVLDQGVHITPLDGQPARFIPHDDVSNVFLMDQDSVILSWSNSAGSIRAISLKAGQTINQYQISTGLEDVQLIQGTTLLFTQDKENTVRILDLFNGNELNPVILELADSENLKFQRLLADGRIGLYEDTNAGQLMLVDMMTGMTIRDIYLYGLSYQVSDDAAKLILKYPTQVLIIDVLTGSDIASLPTFSTEAWSSVMLFGDSQRAAVRNSDQKFIDIWNTLSVSRDARIAFSDPHERIEVVDIFDQAGLVFVMTSTRDFETIRARQSDEVTFIKNSYLYSLSDGQRIAQLSSAKLAELTPQEAMEAQSAPSVIVFENTEKLLTWSRVGRTKIWALADCGDLKATCPASISIEHDVLIDSVTLSPDETKLLAITKIGVVQVWDTSNGELINAFFHGGTVEGAKIWGDANQLITYGTNGFVRFWDLASGKEMRRLNFTPSSREGLGLPSLPDMIQNTEPVPIAPDMSRDGSNETEAVVTYIKIDETGDTLVDGAPVRAFGWGAKSIYVSGVRSEALREASLQVLTHETCQSDDYYGPHEDLHARTFCAHDVVRKTCVGDSGGPIIQGNTLADAKLVGIVSWGSPKCESDNRPGVYTRVASHAEWIKSVLGDDLPAD